MTRMRLRLTVALPLIFLTATATGCGDAGTDPRSDGVRPTREAEGFCPLPEDDRPAPTPCVTEDWNARLKENHAYREPMPITAEQKAEAAPRAKALAAALAELADTGTTEDALRAAAAEAIGMTPEQIEVLGTGFAPLRKVKVGGGEGRVCVNGAVDGSGHADAEVVGRSADGACLPLTGH
ncbi:MULTISPECIES: precorrin-3B C(17)-methyltransferase [Streptomyces]|uniref:Precorrin-3B C(17)-methyltransferase n=2 Tax=Streptomyces flavovirens TaxID=52258 RepID=A0ABV8N8K2_9ACTN|nr:precorrin-3B C(17)-methyltransferase [Streptomyces sp. MBT51]